MNNKTVTQTLVVVCGVCWRALAGGSAAGSTSKGWQALDTILTRERLGPDDYTLADGFCPDCMNALVQERHARPAPISCTPVRAEDTDSLPNAPMR